MAMPSTRLCARVACMKNPTRPSAGRHARTRYAKAGSGVTTLRQNLLVPPDKTLFFYKRTFNHIVPGNTNARRDNKSSFIQNPTGIIQHLWTTTQHGPISFRIQWW